MIEGKGFGSITTLMGGGRYNGLVEEMGGPESPGIGFALSIERLLMALETQNIDLPVVQNLDCYVVALGEEPANKAAALVAELRRAGVSADKDYTFKKMKGQFKAADRFGASYTAILGDNELEKDVINVKEMSSGEQQEVPLEQFVSYIHHKLEVESK